MRSKKHETIADIVAEMRSNEFDDPSFNVYSLVAARTLARGWADRIEAAVNQPVTNCNRLGNAAAMREALEKSDAALSLIAKSAWFMDANFCETREVMEAVGAIKAALAAPPRNCDVLSKDEVLKMLEDRSFSKEDTIEWLYDKAEGENDGSK